MTSPILIAHITAERTSEPAFLSWLRTYRHHDEIEASPSSSGWWFRFRSSEGEDALRIFSCIPEAKLFHQIDAMQLVPLGRRVPAFSLPQDVQWQALVSLSRLWLSIAVESTNGGSGIGSVPMTWVRSHSFREPNALLCQFEDWRHFVMQNIKQCWDYLQFACCQCEPSLQLETQTNMASSTYNTLVLGSPIPSIPGLRLSEIERILVPIEIEWKPAVSSEVLHKAWSMNDQNWALWVSEQQVNLLSDQDFCRASRASISATARRVAVE